MNTMTKGTHAHPNLRVYRTGEDYSYQAKRPVVTAVRPSIRGQLRLMRQLNKGVLIFGLLSELAMFFTGLEAFLDSDWYTFAISIIFAIGIAVMDIFLFFAIHLCVTEIDDQVKKLNKEGH